jgi:hypothetical protein
VKATLEMRTTTNDHVAGRLGMSIDAPVARTSLMSVSASLVNELTASPGFTYPAAGDGTM